MSKIKKAVLSSPSDVYDNILYKGLEGFVMNYGHKLLENYPSSNKIVLEVGPGSQPHFKWMNQKNIEKYIVIDSKEQLQKIKITKDLKNKLVKIPVQNKQMLHKYKGKIDRVIANHVMEHIHDPESFLLDMTAMLKKDGVFSIGLPADPGLLWRFGQLISMKKAMKVYGYKSKEAKDLMWSREHVNAIQRLMAIIKYYFSDIKCSWFPAIIPFINLNLLVVIHLKRSNFRSYE
jgi:2-polyprenyl-3-methyl-5-hydroxy-6-metoxy-1,4-benzoquinol methylase